MTTTSPAHRQSPSPETGSADVFHDGETAIQERLAVRDRVAMLGSRVIREYLPDQHREFYAQLPLIFLGAADATGAVWAGVLGGEPGFISSPDPTTLKLQYTAVPTDPMLGGLQVGDRVGVLGIDFAARRRNRASTEVLAVGDDTLALAVRQSFGNCPQYIQKREVAVLPPRDAATEDIGARLTTDARVLLNRTDNFYIASHFPADRAAAYSGADISHRGGEPGFVRVVDDRVLEFPDYPGNRHFNTLGNLLRYPECGISAIDFASGDVLSLTGAAEIDFSTLASARWPGAERLVRFHLRQARWLRRALPLQWSAPEFSPRIAQLRRA